jgi:hypothetical protein
MKSKSPHVKSYYMKEHSFGQPATKLAASECSGEDDGSVVDE